MEITYFNTRIDSFKLSLISFRLRKSIRLIFLVFVLAVYIFTFWGIFKSSKVNSIINLLSNITVGIVTFYIFLKFMHLIQFLFIFFAAFANNNKGFLCNHTIMLNDELIKETTDFNTTETKIDSLYKIILTKNRIYIFLAPGMAHVIPQSNIIYGDYQEILNRLLFLSESSGIKLKKMNENLFVSYLLLF